GLVRRARARVPLRVARHPRRGRALAQRAGLCEPRTRLRALQHALAEPHAALPAGRAGGAHRGLERRAHLVGARRALRGCGRMAAERRTDPRDNRRRDAQLRRRADAPRAALPRRRCGAHRAAHRREGVEPRGGRRARARAGPRALVRERGRVRAGSVLRDLPRARVARRALLLVDDGDAASLPRRVELPSQAAARAARVRRLFARRGDIACRKLRRPPVGGGRLTARAALGILPSPTRFAIAAMKSLLATAVLAATLATAPVHAAQPVKVGVIAPFSGVAADFGRQMQAGMQAYFKLHGDTFAGRRIELVVRDTGGPNGDVAKRLAQELVTRDKVDFLAGFGFTPEALAVAPVATEAKKPMVVMNAATSIIT